MRQRAAARVAGVAAAAVSPTPPSSLRRGRRACAFHPPGAPSPGHSTPTPTIPCCRRGAEKYEKLIGEEEEVPLEKRVVARAGARMVRGAGPNGDGGWVVRPRAARRSGPASPAEGPGTAHGSLPVPAGKVDAKKRLEDNVQTVLSNNIVQCMGAMVDTVVF